MKNIKTTNITLANGSAAVISTAEIYPGEYETMMASPDFSEEYKVMRSYSKESALSAHKWLKKQYHVAPLSGKYLQLSRDLAEANKKAQTIAQIIKDDGTCNMDSCTLYLPGWNSKKSSRLHVLPVLAVSSGISGVPNPSYSPCVYLLRQTQEAQQLKPCGTT